MLTRTNRAPEILKNVIEKAYARLARAPGTPMTQDEEATVEEAMGMLSRGRLRVASPDTGPQSTNGWTTHAWLKQAILLYFRMNFVQEIETDPFQWTDKIPLKKWAIDMGVRAVPPSTVRFGAYVGRGSVLMPCYVNIGAFVDEGTMVDTWATVGSCAQIGKNVHLSGGVGIGGVLEPPQAQPVIVEDNCFIGSRCVVVEGVIIKTGAVLGAGVVLTKSTAILDVRGSEVKVSKGLIPENCVVIPGSVRKKFPAGEFYVPCAMIIGSRTASTDMKTSLNRALREYDVPV